MKLELPYPPEKLNPNNQYRCKKAHNRVFQKYKRDCFYLATQVKPFLHMRITFHPSCNRPTRNVDNAIAAFKAGQDGIAQAFGVDDSAFVIEYAKEFGEVVKGGSVIVEAL